MSGLWRRQVLSRARLWPFLDLRTAVYHNVRPRFYSATPAPTLAVEPQISHVAGLSPYIDRTPGPGEHIYIAMSSGVDSSTAAALLKQKYPANPVSGIYMANWSSTAKCAEADWNDVQKVCDTIGISCERVNFEKEYWTEVFMPMIDMYRDGMTPNPDVGCNRHIKFGQLVKYLEKIQTTENKTSSNHLQHSQNNKWWLATGHYARVGYHVPSNSVHLLRPKHLPKDQSYYLSSISPSVLPKILFPLADYTKPEIRDLAKHEFNLPTADKPDSQGLCFVSQEQTSSKFRDFLAEYLQPSPGEVVTQDGQVVGKHDGIWHATVGQKSGIAMPQGNPETKGVWYVQSKIPAKNQIVIVKGANNPAFYAKSVTCKNFDWLGSVDTKWLLENPEDISVQYRSLQVPEPVESLSFTPEPSSQLTVNFKSPRRAIAAGQYLVMYNNEGRVLGSGVITSTEQYQPATESEVLHDKLL